MMYEEDEFVVPGSVCVSGAAGIVAERDGGLLGPATTDAVAVATSEIGLGAAIGVAVGTAEGPDPCRLSRLAVASHPLR